MSHGLSAVLRGPPALGIPAALDEITGNRGVLYDVAVVDACLQVLDGGFEFK